MPAPKLCAVALSGIHGGHLAICNLTLEHARELANWHQDGRSEDSVRGGEYLELEWAEQLVKRLLWLIPPARMHLTSFHGVFASHATERARVTL